MEKTLKHFIIIFLVTGLFMGMSFDATFFFSALILVIQQKGFFQYKASK